MSITGGSGGRNPSTPEVAAVPESALQNSANQNVQNLQIKMFDPYRRSWKRWIRRMERAFRIFHIADDGEKVAHLLYYIGVNAFGMLCDQLDPEDPYEKSYDQLKTKLSGFYAPKPLEIVENFIFHQRKQREDENAQQFMTALQKLSSNCKFGSYLQTALRNQFVFGLRNQRTQSRLLEVADLTMENALETATAMELTEQGVARSEAETAASVDFVGANKRNIRKGKGQECNSPRANSSGSSRQTSAQ